MEEYLTIGLTNPLLLTELSTQKHYLQIQMEDVVLVHVSQRTDQLSHIEHNIILRDVFVLGQSLKELTTRHQFQH